MSKLKPTRRVRVRLDFVVEFERPVDSLPFGGPRDADLLAAGVCSALERILGALPDETLRNAEMLGGGLTSVSLDRGKEKP